MRVSPHVQPQRIIQVRRIDKCKGTCLGQFGISQVQFQQSGKTGGIRKSHDTRILDRVICQVQHTKAPNGSRLRNEFDRDRSKAVFGKIKTSQRRCL